MADKPIYYGGKGSGPLYYGGRGGSQMAYGGKWPLWRTENAEAVMKHINGYCQYCADRNVEPFLCFYMHPWEFHEMPSGLIHSGEGAVLPDPFIIKNCGKYAAQEFDRLIQMLKDAGSSFYRACDLVEK